MKYVRVDLEDCPLTGELDVLCNNMEAKLTAVRQLPMRILTQCIEIFILILRHFLEDHVG